MFWETSEKQIQTAAENIKVLLEEERITEQADKLVADLLKGAQAGKEVTAANCEEWIEKRFKPQLVFINLDDYSTALIRALWLAPKFAATDFGSARQRDFAQVWTDTARGFLGEIALQKFLEAKFNIKVKLSRIRGSVEEFLPSDIEEVLDKTTGELHPPSIKLSIKATKFNGRWLDLPGAQHQHSDVFVLVKIGLLRFHFLSYLKVISFIRDKLFVKGKELAELNPEDACALWEEILEFVPIPAYIAGYLEKARLGFPIHALSWKKKGEKNRRIVVEAGIGIMSGNSIRTYLRGKISEDELKLPIEIEPIIANLRDDEQHFLANSGRLNCGETEWQNLVKKL